MSTEVQEFVADLEGGLTEQKLSTALSAVAAGVVDTGKKGRVMLTFDIEQIGNAHQVTVVHKVGIIRPSLRGKSTDEDSGTTAFHVGKGGKMTFSPETQVDFINDAQESKNHA